VACRPRPQQPGRLGRRHRTARAGHHHQRQHPEPQRADFRTLQRQRAQHHGHAFFRQAVAQEALKRGLAYNLGAVGLAQTVASDQRAGDGAARSALLPNINGSLSETVEQNDLAALGLRISVPGFRIPTIVGPFNYFALQASLSQTVANLTAINNYRAAKATARASQYSLQDARDLVTLAVGGAYLQVLAAQARVDAAQAQLDTANAVFHQSTEQHTRGRAGAAQRRPKPGADAHPAAADHHLRNDLAKQKINLARLTGLRPMPAISSPIASPSARRRCRP
jgi:outer membrane protein